MESEVYKYKLEYLQFVKKKQCQSEVESIDNEIDESNEKYENLAL